METLYEILEISNNANITEIKNSYKKNDKNIETGNISISSNEAFIAITKAYEILSDPEKRLSYDKSLRGNNDSYQTITEEVDLGEMNEIEGEWFHDCRCGGVYKVTEKQLEKDISIIQCNGCSLFIRILYQEEFETV